jgi:hypothetical protein
MAQQGVRKVLDVKFHPEGLPQLVSCSNEVSSFYDYLSIFALKYFLTVRGSLGRGLATSMAIYMQILLLP